MTALSKETKRKLVIAVLEDQFKTEVANLQQEFETVFTQAVKDRYQEFSDDYQNFLIKHNLQFNEHHQKPNKIYCKSKYRSNVRQDEILSNASYQYLFEFNRYINGFLYIPQTARWEDDYAIVDDPALEDVLLRQANLIKEIIDTGLNLMCVLDNVRSIKQLQNLTKVFDPFLPKQTTTALVPAVPLLKINALKTPKHPVI